MRIGIYQFASTDSIEGNYETIKKAIGLAAQSSVRLMAFHECALCGYPPIEQNIANIKREDIDRRLEGIASLAERHGMFVAVGTVRFEREKRYNSLMLFDDKGQLMGCYDKKPLWGWDTENYLPGTGLGLFEIDNIKVGFRICFDIRFPELFRELYRQKADLCIVGFSDTSPQPDLSRYEIIKAHIITRAVENVMPIISANSMSGFQTAPTAVFDCNGKMLKEVERNKEGLLIYDFERPKVTFGMRGRLVNNDIFLHIDTARKEDSRSDVAGPLTEMAENKKRTNKMR